MASPVSTKRVYTVKYLRTFKDLPECQIPPSNANFPIVLRRVEKKSQRGKPVQRTPRKAAQKNRPAQWEQDEEEILFVPPSASTAKPSTKKSAEKPKKEKQGANESHYPGKRRLDKIGVDTQGKTPAELFEMEKQQARAKFQKNQADNTPSPSSPSPVISSPIPTKVSDESPIPVEPIAVISVASIERTMAQGKTLSNEEDLLAKFKQASVATGSDVQSPYSSPFQTDVGLSTAFGSDFSEPFSSFKHPPELVSDVDSLFRSTGAPSDPFIPFSSQSAFGSHENAPPSHQRAEFSLAVPGLSQPQPPASTPFPSTEKLATANDIGNNLLRLLEQGMQKQPEDSQKPPLLAASTAPNQPPMHQQSFRGMPFPMMHPGQMHHQPNMNMQHRGGPAGPFPPFNNQRPPMNFYPQQGGPQQGSPQNNDQKQQPDHFASGGYPMRGGMQQHRGGIPQRGGMHQMPPGMNFPMPGGMKQPPSGYLNHYGNVRGGPTGTNQMFTPQHDIRQQQQQNHNMAPHSISSVEGFFNFNQEAASFAPAPQFQVLSLHEIEQRNQAQYGGFRP